MQQFWMWLVIHTSCFPHSQQIRQTHLFNLSKCFCHEFILWRFMINLQRKTNTLALPAFKIIVVLNSHSNTFTHDLNSNKWWWWRFTAVWLHWFEAFLKAQNYNGEIGLHMKSNFNRLYLGEEKRFLNLFFLQSEYFTKKFNCPVDKNGQNKFWPIFGPRR